MTSVVPAYSQETAKGTWLVNNGETQPTSVVPAYSQETASGTWLVGKELVDLDNNRSRSRLGKQAKTHLETWPEHTGARILKASQRNQRELTADPSGTDADASRGSDDSNDTVEKSSGEDKQTLTPGSPVNENQPWKPPGSGLTITHSQETVQSPDPGQGNQGGDSILNDTFHSAEIQIQVIQEAMKGHAHFAAKQSIKRKSATTSTQIGTRVSACASMVEANGTRKILTTQKRMEKIQTMMK